MTKNLSQGRFAVLRFFASLRMTVRQGAAVSRKFIAENALEVKNFDR